MALKGHTTIELTNIETNEVEVHEDDNIFTNALSKLLNPASYGIFCNEPLYDCLYDFTREETIKCLTGGIMLFDKNIDENRDIINTPAGVTVVGCGSQVAYNGNNTMAGSYNQTESGWTDDGGYKHVWDFTTSQANGEISCVSLTTNAGGKITDGTYPYSEDYQYNKGTSDTIKCEKLFTNGNKQIYINYYYLYEHLLFADGINNRLIFPKTTNEISSCNHSGTTSSDYLNFQKTIMYKKSIDLALYRFGFTNFSIFRDNITSDSYVDYVTVNMPDGLSEIFTQEILDNPAYYWNINSISDDNNIYIIIRFKQSSQGDIEVGETVYIWQINGCTFESEYFTFTNNLVEKIGKDTSMYQTNSINGYFQISNDYIACVGLSNKSYIISKSNNNDISEVTCKNGDYVSLNYYYSSGDRIYAINQSNYATMVIDVKTKLASYKNISRYYIFNGQCTKHVFGTHYMVSGVRPSSGSPYIGLYLDPTLLVTINNLSTPVQKTSAQTMKVTYVINEV